MASHSILCNKSNKDIVETHLYMKCQTVYLWQPSRSVLLFRSGSLSLVPSRFNFNKKTFLMQCLLTSPLPVNGLIH